MTTIIEINFDRKCRKCRKPGVTGNGFCLKCNADAMKFARAFADKIPKPKVKNQPDVCQCPKPAAYRSEVRGCVVCESCGKEVRA